MSLPSGPSLLPFSPGHDAKPPIEPKDLLEPIIVRLRAGQTRWASVEGLAAAADVSEAEALVALEQRGDVEIMRDKEGRRVARL